MASLKMPDSSLTRIVLSGYILVPQGELARIREELPKHIAATQAEPGCIVFRVIEAGTPVGRFDVYEEFQNEEAYRYHQKRASESVWGRITRNVERHYSVTGLQG